MSRSQKRARTTAQTSELPRIVTRKPRKGDVHALAASAVRAFLRALPAEQLHGLVRVELRARVDDVGAPFALYRREERDIILYSVPPGEWWMSSLDDECARELERVGAVLVRHRHGVSVHLADGSLDAFFRDVLAHELGHHLRNHTVARYPRVARTADEEAVADLHARRTRARLSRA